jgi:hypothetical protein
VAVRVEVFRDGLWHLIEAQLIVAEAVQVFGVVRRQWRTDLGRHETTLAQVTWFIVAFGAVK